MRAIDKCRKFEKEHGDTLYHKLLWRLGIPLRPSRFLPIIVNVFIACALFIAFTCGIRALVFPQPFNVTQSDAVASLLFGMTYAALQRLKFRGRGLRWRDYGEKLD